ncbi:hypothetical protein KY289_029752 [Solanum tuberosum]|nr:hypothetical protein KY289_029752 [Solanum tuberosum]
MNNKPIIADSPFVSLPLLFYYLIYLRLQESNHSGRTLISISGLFVWTLQVIYLMDKSWINILNRLDPLYENGAKEFLHFASLDRPDAFAILCPCRKCRNMKFVRKDLIVEHIVVDGFLTSYTSWIYHGEELFSLKLVNQLDKGDEVQDMLHEAFGIPPTSFVDMDTSAEGFDGFLLCLKNYVRNRRYPEGAIVEERWIDELMTFCSWYLDDVETKSNPPLRNDVLSNETTDQEGRRSSREKGFKLDDTTRAQAHRYVEKMHMAGEKISEDIQTLAIGPLIQAKRMTGYICDGVRYLTESRDVKRKTQNSGIMLKAITQSYASTKDKNPILAEVSFYGILTDIIELYYSKNLKFVLFKCKWVNNSKGLIEKDDYGFTLVNFNHLLYTRHQLSDEPFIFASQAQQVFYVDHPMEKE